MYSIYITVNNKLVIPVCQIELKAIVIYANS